MAQPNLIRKFRNFIIRQQGRAPWLLCLLVGALAGLGLVSCAYNSQTQLLAPPQIAGATFVGSEACEQCHEDISHDFKTASHYRLKAPGDNAKNIGCESCHGPGSLHVASGGGPNTIVNPRKSPETCFQCHLDKRAEFNLPSHHPVIEGKISCGDCHDPHKGDVIPGGGTELASQNDICGKCHTEQLGPFVFQHEALREGCTTCHNPHGSVNARLLVARNATLCLRCHFQQQMANGTIYIGNSNHSGRLQEGTCWNAGCHEAVHGSNVNPHLRY
ncbi:MAG: cytochrome c3 family protein [Methylacidiphilales bacterium]|nr:cytochrome c3 family protein [Candidatus Methylacidiphilales bacterium]